MIAPSQKSTKKFVCVFDFEKKLIEERIILALKIGTENS